MSNGFVSLPAARAQRRWNPVRRFVRAWGATDDEVEMWLPCDRYVPPPHDRSVRGIDIDAPAEVVWRWLCQMRVAPYSYDWLDNRGHQSPRTLTPGAERLAVGQPIMMSRPWCIFEVADFQPRRHLTMRISPDAQFFWTKAGSFWGTVATSYVLLPRGSDRCRLVVKTVGRAKGGIVQRLRNVTFPAAEALMMRKQLRTFKELAERDARERVTRGADERPWYKRRPLTAPSR